MKTNFKNIIFFFVAALLVGACKPKESKKDYVHISARRVHRCNNGRASYYYEVPKDYKASTIEDLKKTFAIIQKVVFL